MQIRELGLVNHDFEDEFDNLTALAARLLSVPTVLVTVVQPSQDRQFFKSAIGLPGLVSEMRQTPLSHSFCKYVQTTDEPLVIPNARQDIRVSASAAIDDLQMVAYLGVPIHLPDGTALGALCAIDHQPRPWSTEDLRTLQQLAQNVDQLIALRQERDCARATAARASREAEARKTFLAHMSHEIRTPLNGIIASMDLLTRSADSTTPLSARENCELLRTINGAAHNLQRLLNDALDIAKIDAGKLELAPTCFDLRDAVNDVAKLYRAAAAEKDVELVQNYIDLPERAYRFGDQFRLSQILCNLLSNAVKFTDSGRVEICVRGTDRDLRLEISDSGCGIPEDKIASLFDPFRQADASTAHRKGGTGLGMTIVKQMVELMGGRICVESAAGRGSTFRILLPMPVTATAEDGATGSCCAPRPARSDHRPLAGQRVLIADDSPANRLVLQKMLEPLGALVDKAYHGGDALSLALANSYDLLLLDINMPEHNGVEVLRRLHQDRRYRSQAFCVAVTGNVHRDQVADYIAAGFDACIAKPLRQSDLLRALSPLITPPTQAL